MSPPPLPQCLARIERTAEFMITQARHELHKGRTERAYELDNVSTLLLVAAKEIRALHAALMSAQSAVFVPFTGGTRQGGGRVPK